MVSGVFWSAVDRFAVVAIQVVLEVLLARVLMPSDYGLIGMVAVFIAVAQVFVDGGFMNALIRKTDRTETDYSTVFYTSLLIALLIYIILFLCAPLIAEFYKTESLTAIVRVLGLNIIFNSFAIVYRAKLSVSMDFKLQAKFSVISVLISGVVGLWMAYNGYGVWSLVLQLVVLYGLNAVLLVVNLKWIPVTGFSFSSFRTLFGFGSKLLLAGIVNAVYSNMYQLLIGKVYNANDLGIYSKSIQFTLYPSGMITNMLQRVLYPYLSGFQEDDNMLFDLNKKYYTLIAMVFFPLFFGLATLAEPFVSLFLTNKWIEAVPVIRILAITFLFYPFINVNMFIFQIKGMSSRFLAIEVLTKVTGVLILFITLRHNMLMLSYGLLIQHVLQLFITSYFSDKAINAKPFSQIRELAFFFLFSLILYFLLKFFLPFTGDYIVQFILGFVLYVVVYLLYYFIFMKEELAFLLSTVTKNKIS